MTSDAQKKPIRKRKKLLHAKILHQMEFYFSDSNLTRDKFMSERLAENKCIPISLFLNFDKIKSLTLNAEDVSGAVGKSHFLQLSEDKKSVFRRQAFVPKQNVESCTIYVEGVPFHSTDDIIRRTFSAYGTIDRVSVPINRRTGLLHGFGFVEFRTPDMAFNALQAFGAWGRRIRSERYPECMDVASFCDQVRSEPECGEGLAGNEVSCAGAPLSTGASKRALSSDSCGADTPSFKITRFAASAISANCSSSDSSDNDDADFNPADSRSLPSGTSGTPASRRESATADDTSSTTTTTAATTSSLGLTTPTTNTDSLHGRRSNVSSSTTNTTSCSEDCGDSGVTTDSGAVMMNTSGCQQPGSGEGAGGVVVGVGSCHGDDADVPVSAADGVGVSVDKSDIADIDQRVTTAKEDSIRDTHRSAHCDVFHTSSSRKPKANRRPRRSRRRWPMLTEEDSDLLQLQIMPLAEWLRYRSQYRNQQQQHFAALKRSLRQASRAVDGSSVGGCKAVSGDKDCDEDMYEFREGCVVALSEVPATPSTSLLSKVSTVSGTPVAGQRSSSTAVDTISRKCLAQLRQELPGVRYVEVNTISGQPTYIRFGRADNARASLEHPLLSKRRPRLLTGAEESDYWRHLAERRETTRCAPKRRAKVRGKDKLMRRLRSVASKSSLQQDGVLVSLI